MRWIDKIKYGKEKELQEFKEQVEKVERERCVKKIKRLKCGKWYSDHWQNGFEMAKTNAIEAIQSLNQ